jgi:hypothetical protein
MGRSRSSGMLLGAIAPLMPRAVSVHGVPLFPGYIGSLESQGIT